MSFLFISMMPFILGFSMLTLMTQRKHLLMALLSFEGMILGLVASYIFMSPSLETFMAMILLTLGACEASLGLACMVNMSRSFGNDHLSTINSSKC